MKNSKFRFFGPVDAKFSDAKFSQEKKMMDFLLCRCEISPGIQKSYLENRAGKINTVTSRKNDDPVE